MAVMDRLSGAVMLNPDPHIPAGTITVEAGTTFAVTGPPAGCAAAGSTAAGSPTPGSATAGSEAPATTTLPPAAGGLQPSSSADNLSAWDPRPCPAGAPVKSP